jgi:tetratricopeptide (TPR) repeat protein
MNLAEAFYLAMPSLSWQTVVVGDPLCAPFRARPIADTELDGGLDPVSGLPVVFSDRRAAALMRPGIDATAVRLLMKAEGQLSSGDRPGARETLERATSLAGRLTPAQLLLALAYEADGDYDKALSRYRQVVENEPANVIALNNLAYALAARGGTPADALPFAERAYQLSPTEPGVIDTLAWIHHALGDSTRALPLLQEAARLASTNAEIHLHAAVVAAATGRAQEAERYLARALALAPHLADSDQVAAVRRQLR